MFHVLKVSAFLSLYFLAGLRFGVLSQCILNPLSANRAPVVNTTLGPVLGSKVCSRINQTYFQYLGIPYAEPPVGDLRFEPPVAYKTPWTRTRPAYKWGSECLQFDALLLGHVTGDEDCLFLNIFTPSLKPSTPFPVMVWIHGGGFTAGGSQSYIPSYFMDGQDIVVVSMNYRLGALGFLNTGDDLVRGNMGLKDQNMALRFAQDNIARFGGNPNKVTIFGESSGAASVHYHVISPLSKGLFHRAIMQSGNVFCPWAYTKSPNLQALRFGGIMGCPNRTTSELVNCLKQADGSDIVSKHSVILSPLHKQDDIFAGSTEMGQRRRSSTFLPENPFVMLNRGDFNRVPVIFGVNSGEGALKTARLEAYPDILKRTLQTWEGWSENAPILLHYNKEWTNVSNSLISHYFPQHSKNTKATLPSNTAPSFITTRHKRAASQDDYLRNLTRMISDGVWFHATEMAARNHSKFAPAYLNYFSYMPDSLRIPSAYTCLKEAQISSRSPITFWITCVLLGVFDDFFNGKRFGAVHTDDLIYYWGLAPTPEITETFPDHIDYLFSKDLVTTFSSFVKQVENLNFRNVTWERVGDSAKPLQYIQFDKNGKMIPHPSQDGIDYIESLNIRDPFSPNNY